MSKLEERESRRRSPVVGSMIESAPTPSNGKKGRPKKVRETKKRVSLSVLPSLYGDIQKIAYVQRRSTSELVAQIMEEYRSDHQEELEEYEKIRRRHN